MCGRAYSTYTEEELALRYGWEKAKRSPLGLKPNYNLSPTQLAPVVLMRDGGISIEMFRFGLVPFWAKDLKSISKYSLINAKSEEIETKRSYQQAFLKRRCIIPLSGFFEWKRSEEAGKRPFAIHLKESPIMSVAGVWENWHGDDSDQEILSFSIITTDANAFMKKIHDRMPVILAKEDEEKWLDPENCDPASLRKLMKSCSANELTAHEVSTLVNSPRNNRREILNPV